MGRISVEEAGRIMGVTAQFVRVTLQQEKVDWGYAVRMPGGRYTYYVNEERLKDWLKSGAS